MAHKRGNDWPQQAYKYRIYFQNEVVDATTDTVQIHRIRNLSQFDMRVQDEAYQMRSLWNQLVDVWTENSEQYQALLIRVEAVRDLTAAREAAVETHRRAAEELKKARARHRTKIGPALAQFMADKAEKLLILKALNTELKAKREEARVQLRPELTALQEQLWARVGECLKGGRIGWSNKELVQQGFEACLKRFFKKTGDPPKKKFGPLTNFTFRHRFSGGGLPLHSLFRAGPNRVWIETQPPPEAYAPHRPDSVKKALARVKGGVMLANIPYPIRIMLHRAMPPGAKVKTVTISGERAQRQYYHTNFYQANWRYHMVFGLEIPPAQFHRIVTRIRREKAAIDLNWRIFNERIRFGFLSDSEGLRRELFLPAYILNDWRFCQEMQEKASRSIDDVKAVFQGKRWFTDEEWKALPDEHHGLFQNFALLRGPGGLWRLLRLELDGLIPGTLFQDWAKRWSSKDRQRNGVHGRLVRARNDYFRVLTNQLCQEYDEISIEKLALDRLATQESNKIAIELSQQYRQLTGLSYFISYLKQSAAKWSCTITERDPKNTTRACNICGLLMENSANLFIECPNGHRWDQDDNASRNLMVATA